MGSNWAAVPMLALALAAALGLPGRAASASSGAARTLRGTDGPGFTITLRDSAGHQVTRLRSGTYTIVVRDLSSIHNFHLRGPGLNRLTSVARTGTTRWTVRLQRGRYTYVCDPHRTIMHGSFTVA